MKKTLTCFYSYILRDKKTVLTAFLFVLAATVLSELTPFFYRDFVDGLGGGLFVSLGYIFALLFVVKALSVVLFQIFYILSDKYSIGAARDARLAVFNHLHELDFSFLSSTRAGTLISIMKRGDNAFFSFHHELNTKFPRLVVRFLFAVVILFTVDLKYSLILLAAVLFLILTTRHLIVGNIRKRRLLNDEEDHIGGIIADNLVNFETVKYFAREKWEEERIKGRYRSWMDRVWDYSLTFRAIDLSTEGLSLIGTFIIVGLALVDAYRRTITVGDFVFISTAAGSFFPRMSEFMYSLREIAKHFSDLERYFGILGIPIQVKDPPKPAVMPKIKGDIFFKNVSFSYADRGEVLSEVNLRIRPGQSVALVGRSGAGKTTLIKLLMRFYDVQKGGIFIDGVNIRDFSKSDLRCLVGVVPQEAILFNDTLGFNIGYARDEVGPEEIERAAAMAHLDGFVRTLPKGFETVVGERGIKLSGGQKQRLAIARAILKNPRIIVFDEATSHLDSESEKMIQDAFWKIARGKTTIIIAHRFSTVMRADRIVVVEKGRIIEEGTHQELISLKSGVYKLLWRLQTEGEITG